MPITSIRSEEIQEIIGRPPHWIVRWGTVIFLGVLVLVLLFSWLIRYPDKLEVSFQLGATSRSSTLKAVAEGDISEIFVPNGQVVKEGDTVLALGQGEYVVAPIAGKLSYTQRLFKGSMVKAGEQLCRILPLKTGYMGYVAIPPALVNQVKEGQTLLINFTGQQGVVNGVVGNISDAMSDSVYLATVRLPEGLKTDRQEEIVYREGMSGKATIIIARKRLLEKVLKW